MQWNRQHHASDMMDWDLNNCNLLAGAAELAQGPGGNGLNLRGVCGRNSIPFARSNLKSFYTEVKMCHGLIQAAVMCTEGWKCKSAADWEAEGSWYQMSVELLPCFAAFDKSLEPLVLQWRQVQPWVRSRIPITGHVHPLCLDLRQTAFPSSLYLQLTLQLVHETGPWIFKAMCDKQALCNELT